jgi:hypothetical protein
VKSLVVVALLLVVLVTPCVAAAWNMWCDIAAATGKVSDWIVCGVVAVMMGDGIETFNGYVVYG